MVTMQSLENKLLALISKSNEHTKQSDTNLTDAINSLIAYSAFAPGGEGAGGEMIFSGNGNVQLLFNGEVVPSSGTNGNITLSIGGGS